MKYVICSSIFIFITAGLAHATDRVLGETITFQSYNGVPEACVRITPIPGGRYDEEDLEDEVALCSLDLYSESIALCPKIWSTSPAVVLYDIGEGKFKGDRAGFQSKICAGGKVAKHVSEGQISRVSDLLCMSNLAHASKPKEHDDNDNYEGSFRRAAERR